jgi:ribonuclease Z
MTDPKTGRVVPLGVAAALPDASHVNSYLTVLGESGYWLVDCADTPIARLQEAGVEPAQLSGVVITHFHPDHVYGLPAYLLGLFLLRLEHGYEVNEVPIYARPEVLERVRSLVGLFDDQDWLDTLPLRYQSIEPRVGATVAECDDFVISATPSQHSIPSLALRFTGKGTGRSFVYSSDTAPSDGVVELARDADLLFHEATGDGPGHTRPKEAGEVARRAGVERLVLIHYPPEKAQETLREARAAFAGSVELARAFTSYPW